MRFQHYILLSFSLFIAFIIVLVIKTYKVNNELVTEDYYNQELNYQDKINKMAQVSPETDVKWEQTDKYLVLSFPEKTVANTLSGNVEFYRPSDAAKDLKIPLSLNENGQQIFLNELFKKGLYKIKVDWKQHNLSFYSERDIYIP